MPSAPRTALRPIVVVDDSLDDVFFISRAIQKAGIRNPVQIARDVPEAIAVLEKARPGSNFAVPILICTDLRMPGQDGFELLRWIGRAPNLQRVLTAVVSTSSLPKDIERAYQCGCHAYLPKHPSPAHLGLLLAAAENFSDGLPIGDLPGLIRPDQSTRELA